MLFYFQDTNEKIFFSLLSKNIEKYLPIVYTPTVGLACQRFGLIYRRPRGLFITIYDKGHVLNILNNWYEFCILLFCCKYNSVLNVLILLGLSWSSVSTCYCKWVVSSILIWRIDNFHSSSRIHLLAVVRSLDYG